MINMDTITIQLSPQLYEKVTQQADAQQQSVEHFVIAVLSEKVAPPHPYVTVVDSRSGPRPVLKETRIGVDVIVGYVQAGYDPQEIAMDILPQLTPAQVYDALSYYEDHREMIDAAMVAHTPDAWRARLQEELGDEAAAKLLGA
jgi:uncharacterized protein (DUF433 family)